MDIEEIRRINKQAILEAKKSLNKSNDMHCILLWIISTIIIYSILVIVQPKYLTELAESPEGTEVFSVKKALLVSGGISIIVPFILL